MRTHLADAAPGPDPLGALAVAVVCGLVVLAAVVLVVVLVRRARK